jgi:hypothetical protein
MNFIKPETLSITSYGGSSLESLRLIDVLSRACTINRASVYERIFESSFLRINDSNLYKLINKTVDKTDFFDFTYDRSNLDSLLKGMGAMCFNGFEVVNSSLYDFTEKFSYKKVSDSLINIIDNRFKYLLIRQRLLENTIGYTLSSAKKFDEYVLKSYENNRKINKDFFVDFNNVLLMFSNEERHKNSFLTKVSAYNGTMVSRFNSTDSFNHKRKLNALYYIFELKSEEFYKSIQCGIDFGSDEIVYRFMHNPSNSVFRIDYQIGSKEFKVNLNSPYNPKISTDQLIKKDLDTTRPLRLLDAFEKIISKHEKKESV